jgi:predicted metal-dependent phosphotriesterase family hydrolase
MPNKEVTKEVTDFRVEIADNGFVVEFSGYDKDGDYASNKRVVMSPQELHAAIDKIIAMA